jgi:hypothetical protein
LMAVALTLAAATALLWSARMRWHEGMGGL